MSKISQQIFLNSKNYLKNNSYGNAEQNDLWAELDAQAKIDGTLSINLSVKSIMDTWTLRKGYPVVKIERLDSSNQLSVTQKWFLLNPLNKLKDTVEYNDYRWFVPFTFTTKNNPNFDFESNTTWFEPTQDKSTLFYLKNILKIISNIMFFLSNNRLTK